MNAANATVDAANDTLSWTAPSAAWADGDKLMVRIHNGTAHAPTPLPPTATPTPPPPTDPTGVKAKAGDGSVTLAWNNPSDSGITRYEHQMRKTGAGWGGWTAIPGSGSSTTSYVVKGLTNGIERRFRVRAVGAGGAGVWGPNAPPGYVSVTPQSSKSRR